MSDAALRRYAVWASLDFLYTHLLFGSPASVATNVPDEIRVVDVRIINVGRKDHPGVSELLEFVVETPEDLDAHCQGSNIDGLLIFRPNHEPPAGESIAIDHLARELDGWIIDARKQLGQAQALGHRTKIAKARETEIVVQTIRRRLIGCTLK